MLLIRRILGSLPSLKLNPRELLRMLPFTLILSIFWPYLIPAYFKGRTWTPVVYWPGILAIFFGSIYLLMRKPSFIKIIRRPAWLAWPIAVFVSQCTLFGSSTVVFQSECVAAWAYMDHMNHCEGNTGPGFMGSNQYYRIAAGTPKAEICERVSSQNPSKARPCEKKLPDFQCFSETSASVNGNSQRHSVLALTHDCSRAVYLDSSNVSASVYASRMFWRD